MTGKWPTLVLLSIATLLGMSVWFSASAVVPQLTLLWQLDDSGRAWLTMSVQIGFVVGALGSSLLNLADRLPARWMMSISSVLAALATASIAAFASSLGPALVLRFLTGVALAGVYPVAMKTMATWTKADRGLGIGLLVGALTLGSGAPHLINASGGIGDSEQSSATARSCSPTLDIWVTCGNCLRCGPGCRCFYWQVSVPWAWILGSPAFFHLPSSRQEPWGAY